MPGMNGGASDGMFLDPQERQNGLTPENFNPTGGERQAGASGQDASEGEPQAQPGQSKEELLELRRRYHQGRADRALAEIGKMREFLTGNEKALTLGKMVMERPEIQALVFQPAAGAKPADELKAPEAPVRPDSFNKSEALADPESASGKYLAAMEKYRDDKIVYLEKLQAKRDTEFREMFEQQKTAREMEARNNQVATILVNDYGFRQHELGEFFRMVESEPNLDDLVAAYRSRQSRTRDTHERGTPQREARNAPPPPVRMGHAQPPGTIDQAAGMNLIRASGGRR